ncbi:MAG TPA: NfeD family protein, partial [Verrucomicrobiae bacterium]|nr:NfeD family protein [Verrucomicrobiae bacterium]
GILSGSLYVAGADGNEQLVFIPIKGTIEPGQVSFVERSLDKAYRMGAKKVVLDIDTPGGLIDSAKKIKNLVIDSKVPVDAFVSGEAKSAGVLVALSTERIYLNPGASMGAAEPIPNNEKILSSWRSDLESAAEARGRNGNIAAGMADKDIVIENVKDRGEILSLSAEKAVELAMADKIVQGRSGLLTELAQKDGVYYQAAEINPGWGEKLAWWIINPFISPILLLLGFAGLLAEGFTPGWGVGGTIGIVALGIYFAGHLMAGVTGWMAVFIFFLGLLAILLEIFVIPGFGMAGIIGMGMVVWGVFLSSTSPVQAVVSLSVAALGSIVLLYVMVKVLGRKGMWNRIILGTRLDTETGYLTPKKGLDKYRDAEGISLTPLRPAGVAEILGDRVDVITEGGFIPPGAPVRVVLIEGGRVVVRPVSAK